MCEMSCRPNVRPRLRRTFDIGYRGCYSSQTVGFVRFVVFVDDELDEVGVVVVLTEHVLYVLVA